MIGFIIGLFIGANIGLITFALLSAAKRGDQHEATTSRSVL